MSKEEYRYIAVGKPTCSCVGFSSSNSWRLLPIGRTKWRQRVCGKECMSFIIPSLSQMALYLLILLLCIFVHGRWSCFQEHLLQASCCLPVTMPTSFSQQAMSALSECENCSFDCGISSPTTESILPVTCNNGCVVGTVLIKCAKPKQVPENRNNRIFQECQCPFSCLVLILFKRSGLQAGLAPRTLSGQHPDTSSGRIIFSPWHSQTTIHIQELLPLLVNSQVQKNIQHFPQHSIHVPKTRLQLKHVPNSKYLIKHVIHEEDRTIGVLSQPHDQLKIEVTVGKRYACMKENQNYYTGARNRQLGSGLCLFPIAVMLCALLKSKAKALVASITKPCLSSSLSMFLLCCAFILSRHCAFANNTAAPSTEDLISHAQDLGDRSLANISNSTLESIIGSVPESTTPASGTASSRPTPRNVTHSTVLPGQISSLSDEKLMRLEFTTDSSDKFDKNSGVTSTMMTTTPSATIHEISDVLHRRNETPSSNVYQKTDILTSTTSSKSLVTQVISEKQSTSSTQAAVDSTPGKMKVTEELIVTQVTTTARIMSLPTTVVEEVVTSSGHEVDQPDEEEPNEGTSHAPLAGTTDLNPKSSQSTAAGRELGHPTRASVSRRSSQKGGDKILTTMQAGESASFRTTSDPNTSVLDPNSFESQSTTALITSAVTEEITPSRSAETSGDNPTTDSQATSRKTISSSTESDQKDSGELQSPTTKSFPTSTKPYIETSSVFVSKDAVTEKMLVPETEAVVKAEHPSSTTEASPVTSDRSLSISKSVATALEPITKYTDFDFSSSLSSSATETTFHTPQEQFDTVQDIESNTSSATPYVYTVEPAVETDRPIKVEPVVPEEQSTTVVLDEKFTTILPQEHTTTVIPEEQITTVIPQEQTVTVIPEEQSSTVIPEEQPSTVIPEVQTTTVSLKRQSSTLIPEEQSFTVIPEEQSSTVVPEEPSSTVIPEERSTTFISEHKSTTVIPEEKSPTIISEDKSTTGVEELTTLKVHKEHVTTEYVTPKDLSGTGSTSALPSTSVTTQETIEHYTADGQIMVTDSLSHSAETVTDVKAHAATSESATTSTEPTIPTGTHIPEELVTESTGLAAESATESHEAPTASVSVPARGIASQTVMLRTETPEYVTSDAVSITAESVTTPTSSSRTSTGLLSTEIVAGLSTGLTEDSPSTLDSIETDILTTEDYMISEEVASTKVAVSSTKVTDGLVTVSSAEPRDVLRETTTVQKEIQGSTTRKSGASDLSDLSTEVTSSPTVSVQVSTEVSKLSTEATVPSAEAKTISTETGIAVSGDFLITEATISSTYAGMLSTEESTSSAESAEAGMSVTEDSISSTDVTMPPTDAALSSTASEMLSTNPDFLANGMTFSSTKAVIPSTKAISSSAGEEIFSSNAPNSSTESPSPSTETAVLVEVKSSTGVTISSSEPSMLSTEPDIELTGEVVSSTEPSISVTERGTLSTEPHISLTGEALSGKAMSSTDSTVSSTGEEISSSEPDIFSAGEVVSLTGVTLPSSGADISTELDISSVEAAVISSTKSNRLSTEAMVSSTEATSSPTEETPSSTEESTLSLEKVVSSRFFPSSDTSISPETTYLAEVTSETAILSSEGTAFLTESIITASEPTLPSSLSNEEVLTTDEISSATTEFLTTDEIASPTESNTSSTSSEGSAAIVPTLEGIPFSTESISSSYDLSTTDSVDYINPSEKFITEVASSLISTADSISVATEQQATTWETEITTFPQTIVAEVETVTATEPLSTTTETVSITEAEEATIELQSMATELQTKTTEVGTTRAESIVATTESEITTELVATTEAETTTAESETKTTELVVTTTEPETTTEPDITTTKLETTTVESGSVTSVLTTTEQEASTSELEITTNLETTTDAETTTEQAAITEPEPVTTTTEPVTTTAELVTTTTEPVTTTTEPVTTTAEPVTTTTEPVTTTTEQVTTTTEPTTTTTEPTTASTIAITTIIEARTTTTTEIEETTSWPTALPSDVSDNTLEMKLQPQYGDDPSNLDVQDKYEKGMLKAYLVSKLLTKENEVRRKRDTETMPPNPDNIQLHVDELLASDQGSADLFFYVTQGGDTVVPARDVANQYGQLGKTELSAYIGASVVSLPAPVGKADASSQVSPASGGLAPWVIVVIVVGLVIIVMLVVGLGVFLWKSEQRRKGRGIITDPESAPPRIRNGKSQSNGKKPNDMERVGLAMMKRPQVNGRTSPKNGRVAPARVWKEEEKNGHPQPPWADSQCSNLPPDGSSMARIVGYKNKAFDVDGATPARESEHGEDVNSLNVGKRSIAVQPQDRIPRSLRISAVDPPPGTTLVSEPLLGGAKTQDCDNSATGDTEMDGTAGVFEHVAKMSRIVDPPSSRSSPGGTPPLKFRTAIHPQNFSSPRLSQTEPRGEDPGGGNYSESDSEPAPRKKLVREDIPPIKIRTDPLKGFSLPEPPESETSSIADLADLERMRNKQRQQELEHLDEEEAGKENYFQPKVKENEKKESEVQGKGHTPEVRKPRRSSKKKRREKDKQSRPPVPARQQPETETQMNGNHPNESPSEPHLPIGKPRSASVDSQLPGELKPGRNMRAAPFQRRPSFSSDGRASVHMSRPSPPRDHELLQRLTQQQLDNNRPHQEGEESRKLWNEAFPLARVPPIASQSVPPSGVTSPTPPSVNGNHSAHTEPVTIAAKDNVRPKSALEKLISEGSLTGLPNYGSYPGSPSSTPTDLSSVGSSGPNTPKKAWYRGSPLPPRREVAMPLPRDRPNAQGHNLSPEEREVLIKAIHVEMDKNKNKNKGKKNRKSSSKKR